MSLIPFKFDTLSEAIEKAHRSEESNTSSAVVTGEDDGSCNLYGAANSFTK
jgi:hypothetical protein